MTCEQVGLALDDAHDRGAVLGAEALAHVALCASCSAYAQFLERLPAEVAALPRELAPSRDLWDGVRAGIGRKRVVALDAGRKPARAMAPYWAAAAALLVGVGAGALWMKTRPAVSRQAAAVAPSATPGPAAPLPSAAAPASAASAPAAADATAAAVPASYQTGAADFARATADLMAVLDERRGSMTPETRTIVEKNLAVIDTALRQIESALRKEPGNSDLVRMLGATRKRKIETLQLVVKLTA
jgi:hypothetical protein